jgi:hypothetical protein
MPKEAEMDVNDYVSVAAFTVAAWTMALYFADAGGSKP